MDALPPPPPASYSYAPGDIYPRGSREEELCDRASHPDWLYLAGLVVLNAGAIVYGSNAGIQDNASLPVRFTAPVFVGLAWGAGIGGGYLSLPHCDPHYVGGRPREGEVTADWPLTISLALLAGATAPMIDGILVGNQPQDWTTLERSMHVVAAGLAGLGGALLPYLLPPSSWSAARQLDKLRVGTDARGGVTVGVALTF